MPKQGGIKAPTTFSADDSPVVLQALLLSLITFTSHVQQTLQHN